MSLVPKVWYSAKMSGLHSSPLCVEHDKAYAMYANITLAVFVCVCVFRASTPGPIEVVHPVRVDWFKNHVHLNAAKSVRRPGDTRRGPQARNTLSVVWQMAKRSLVLFRASYKSLWLSLLNATIQAINAKVGHEHLFERRAVLYLSMFW